eukprot:tig00000821_g4504.t1
MEIDPAPSADACEERGPSGFTSLPLDVHVLVLQRALELAPGIAEGRSIGLARALWLVRASAVSRTWRAAAKDPRVWECAAAAEALRGTQADVAARLLLWVGRPIALPALELREPALRGVAPRDAQRLSLFSALAAGAPLLPSLARLRVRPYLELTAAGDVVPRPAEPLPASPDPPGFEAICRQLPSLTELDASLGTDRGMGLAAADEGCWAPLRRVSVALRDDGASSPTSPRGALREARVRVGRGRGGGGGALAALPALASLTLDLELGEEEDEGEDDVLAPLAAAMGDGLLSNLRHLDVDVVPCVTGAALASLAARLVSLRVGAAACPVEGPADIRGAPLLEELDLFTAERTRGGLDLEDLPYGIELLALAGTAPAPPRPAPPRPASPPLSGGPRRDEPEGFLAVADCPRLESVQAVRCWRQVVSGLPCRALALHASPSLSLARLHALLVLAVTAPPGPASGLAPCDVDPFQGPALSAACPALGSLTLAGLELEGPPEGGTLLLAHGQLRCLRLDGVHLRRLRLDIRCPLLEALDLIRVSTLASSAGPHVLSEEVVDPYVVEAAPLDLASLGPACPRLAELALEELLWLYPATLAALCAAPPPRLARLSLSRRPIVPLPGPPRRRRRLDISLVRGLPRSLAELSLSFPNHALHLAPAPPQLAPALCPTAAAVHLRFIRIPSAAAAALPAAFPAASAAGRLLLCSPRPPRVLPLGTAATAQGAAWREPAAGAGPGAGRGLAASPVPWDSGEEAEDEAEEEDEAAGGEGGAGAGPVAESEVAFDIIAALTAAF